MTNPNNTIRAILDAAEECDKRGKSEDAKSLRAAAALIAEMYADKTS